VRGLLATSPFRADVHTLSMIVDYRDVQNAVKVSIVSLCTLINSLLLREQLMS